MDKYYSYTDFLKAVGQQPAGKQSEKLLNEIYLDLFISRLQRMHRIEQLTLLIDNSLDQKNERDFFHYASELKTLLETPISWPKKSPLNEVTFFMVKIKFRIYVR